MARGTWTYILQIWISFFGSIVFTFAGLAVLEVEMTVKGFLGLGMVFMTYSAFHLAKTMRDMADKARPPPAATLFLTSFAVVLSFVATIGGIFVMNLGRDQKSFVSLGAACTLNAAFSMAKLLMDTEELGRLRGSAACTVPVTPSSCRTTRSVSTRATNSGRTTPSSHHATPGGAECFLRRDEEAAHGCAQQQEPF
jgi:hypothetical protein